MNIFSLKSLIGNGGGGGGIEKYKELPDKPKVNGNVLIDDKSSHDLGIIQEVKLSYDGTNIKKGNEVQTIEDIKNLYADNLYQVKLSYLGVDLFPSNYNENNTFSFIGSYYKNNKPFTLIISIDINGTVTEVSIPGVVKYEDILEKPKIENNEIKAGNNTADSLGIVPATRKIADKVLTGDITAQDIENATKEISAIFKNKEIDATYNDVKNIIVACFKSDAYVKEIRSKTSASDSAFVTELGIRKAIEEAIAGVFKIQGNKLTEAEILELTGTEDYEAWICEANGKLYYWLNGSWHSVMLLNISDYVKKTTKIGTNTLDNDISADDLYDDLDPKIERYYEVNTFTGVTGSKKALYYLTQDIPGFDKGLYRYDGTNFVLAGGGVTLIPIQNSEKGTISKNTKAFYKVAYANNRTTIEFTDGTNWFIIWDSAEDTSVYDLSENVAEDTYNKTNFVFETNKLKCFNGIATMNEEFTIKAPPTEIVAGSREYIHLPTLPQGYEYPSKMRVNVVKNGGQYTCEVNRHHFYDPDGEHYVDPNIGVDATFMFYTLIAIPEAYDSEGNPILITDQKKNDFGDYIVNLDGSPLCSQESVQITQGQSDQPKLYAFLYEEGKGYSHLSEYYTKSGERKTGSFYKLNEVSLSIDTNYLYLCKLADTLKTHAGNFKVNSNGVVCNIKITQSQSSLAFKAKEATMFPKFKYGCAGTVEFIPINFAEATNQVDATIENNKLKIMGTICPKTISISSIF